MHFIYQKECRKSLGCVLYIRCALSKNTIFNLNVLLTLCLEYFFFNWSYIKWCMNISAIIRMLKWSRLLPLNFVTMSHSNWNHLHLFAFLNFQQIASHLTCLGLCTRVVQFVLVADKTILGLIFSWVLQFHCISITQPVVVFFPLSYCRWTMGKLEATISGDIVSC
jgi:hypothetical protein